MSMICMRDWIEDKDFGMNGAAKHFPVQHDPQQAKDRAAEPNPARAHEIKSCKTALRHALRSPESHDLTPCNDRATNHGTSTWFQRNVRQGGFPGSMTKRGVCF